MVKVTKVLVQKENRLYKCIPLHWLYNKNEKAYKKYLTFFEKGLI